MQLHDPVVITPRLLPGLKLGGGWISIEYAPPTDERTRFKYYFDLPANEHGHKPSLSAADLRSGVGTAKLQDGLVSLLAFLNAAGEEYDRHGETEMFPNLIAEWASMNSEQLILYRLILNGELREEPDRTWIEE